MKYYLHLLLPLLLFTACQPDSNTDITTDIQSDIADQPKAFSPTDTKADLLARGVPHVTVNTTTFFVGYQQVSANNQDPIFARFDGDDMTYVRTDYEITGDDHKGYGLMWDGGPNLYAVFSATGTQGDPSDDFRRFATGGWLSSYGQGGGPKVAILARINPDLGTVMNATFLRAKLSNGNTNSLAVKALDFKDDQVIVQANAWFSPLNTDGSAMTCQGNSPFDYSITLNQDLSQALQASAPNCQ